MYSCMDEERKAMVPWVCLQKSLEEPATHTDSKCDLKISQIIKKQLITGTKWPEKILWHMNITS